MSINNIITPLTIDNQPFDLNHSNVNEQVYFFYDRYANSTSSTSWLNILGNEKWVWDFDNQASTSGTNSTGGMSLKPTDQVLCEFNGKFTLPISANFTRSGARTVSLSIYSPSGTNSSYILKYFDRVSFDVYSFPDQIYGPDYVSPNSSSFFYVNSTLQPSNFNWSLNGKQQPINNPQINVSFLNIFKQIIYLQIVNGRQSKVYSKTVSSFVGNVTLGNTYESNVTPNLVFFNKKGDFMNFEYQSTDTTNTWVGDMIFDANSSDTFKSIGLYIMEKVESFNFSTNDLQLQKFQTFNEHGMEFQPVYFSEIEIDDIQTTNNSTSFFTKWLISPNINRKFPIGTDIYLQDVTSIFLQDIVVGQTTLNDYKIIADLDSFSSTSGTFKTYTILSAKKDAIMVMTDIDNYTFNNTYKMSNYVYGYGSYRLQNNAIKIIPKGKVCGLNLIKVFKGDQLNVEWNEDDFFNLLYDKKKLTVVNSKLNDGVKTVNFINDDIRNVLNDKIIKTDYIDIQKLIPDSKYPFKIDIQFKTNQILLSQVPVDFLSASPNPYLNNINVLVWESFQNKDYTPTLLRIGSGFFFEQTTSIINNLDNIFKVTRIDTAQNILTYQTNDKRGYKLIIKNFTLASNSISYNFNVNNTTYELITNISFNTGSTLEEYILNLATKLNSIIGLAVTIQNNEILIWEKVNYILSDFKVIDKTTKKLDLFKLYSFVNGALPLNNPTQIIVGDRWYPILNQSIDNSDFNGYVHYRIDQGNYHIAYINGNVGSQKVTWYTLPVNKKIIGVESTNDITFKENIISNCYSLEDTISFEQLSDGTSGNSEILVNRFVQNYKNSLNQYGLDSFIQSSSTSGTLNIQRSYPISSTQSKSDYINVNFYTSSDNFYKYSSTSGTSGTSLIRYFDILSVPSYIDTSFYNSTSAIPAYLKLNNDKFYDNYQMFNTIEDLELEQHRTHGKHTSSKSISKNFRRDIIINDIDPDYGFHLTINGIDYNVTKNTISTNSSISDNQLLSAEETLMDWGNQRLTLSQDIIPNEFTEVGRRYYEILENLGILVWLEKSGLTKVNNISLYDKLVIESKYPNVGISYDIQGTLLSHKILHTDIILNELGTLLNIIINGEMFNVPFNTNKIQTVTDWVTLAAPQLLELNIIAEQLYDGTSGTSIRLSTFNENDNLKFSVYVGKTPILGKNLYDIVSYRIGNQGIVLSGNTIGLYNGLDFQSIGYATGMVTSLSNSTFPLNNQNYNIILVEPTLLGLSYQGPFWNNNEGSFIEERSATSQSIFIWDDYSEYGSVGTNFITNPYQSESTSGLLTLYTKEYIRFPRERYDGERPTQFRISWEDNIDNSMFFLDFSGRELQSVNDSLKYRGNTPLLTDSNEGFLNNMPNKDITKLSDPKSQQTVFDVLTYDLQMVDSEIEIDPLPEPLQVFVGYKSLNEGVNKKTLLIHRLENITCTIRTRLENEKALIKKWIDIIYFEYIIDSNYEFDVAKIYLDNFDYLTQNTQASKKINQNINFVQIGYKKGQLIRVSGKDWINNDREAIFSNAGVECQILEVYVTYLKVRPLNKLIVNEVSLYQAEYQTKNPDIFKLKVSIDTKAPYTLRNAALQITIEVIPELIASITLRGQTEIEDDRFKIGLDNLGKKISHKDVFIFKQYDINESGIDWIYVNQKRKEMLIMFPEIYNYLGTYKALINAINYFGYNDLQVNEYYLNIDSKSEKYGQYQKIEIPDIFDNTVPGWSAKDWLKDSVLDSKYKKTRLSNLSYTITDFEGNYILGYSLDEIITKLMGLKKWLQENIMPIGTRIKDITGRGSTLQTTTLWHDVRFNRKFTVSESLSPVDFKIEAYLQPVENASRSYNIHLEFFTKNIDNAPLYYHVKITTYSAKPNFTDTSFKLKSVQTINLFKIDYLAYNFAADRYVDPFIYIEITSDNGRGANYSIRRTYSIEVKKFI